MGLPARASEWERSRPRRRRRPAPLDRRIVQWIVRHPRLALALIGMFVGWRLLGAAPGGVAPAAPPRVAGEGERPAATDHALLPPLSPDAADRLRDLETALRRRTRRPPRSLAWSDPLQERDRLASVRTSVRVAALTFDDGPHPRTTPRVLDLLARERVCATFFVVGKQARKWPGLVRRAVREGHEIGNHTYHHAYLTELSEADRVTEVEATEEVLRPLVGKPSRWLRPPGGFHDAALLADARRWGMRLALWSVDARDWSEPPARVIRDRVLAALKPGCVILLHDTRRQTLAALPEILVAARERGYRFVRLGELESAAGAPPPSP